jgi:hypothetical protein
VATGYAYSLRVRGLPARGGHDARRPPLALPHLGWSATWLPATPTLRGSAGFQPVAGTMPAVPALALPHLGYVGYVATSGYAYSYLNASIGSSFAALNAG